MRDNLWTKWSTTIVLLAANILGSVYILSLFDGASGLRTLVFGSPETKQAAWTGGRQTVLNDIEAVRAAVSPATSFIPDDPLVASLLIATILGLLMLCGWNPRSTSAWLKGLMKHDDVDELDGSETGGEDVAE